MKLNKRKAAHGGVFVELGMSIPVLMLFIAGISNFGAYMSVLFWIDHTAYHIANVGAGSLPNEREVRMQDISGRLRKYHQTALHINQSDSLNLEPAGSADATKPVETSASVDGLSLFTGDIIDARNETVVTPLIPPLLADNDLEQFENPSHLRGCCGEKGGDPTEDCTLPAPNYGFRDCSKVSAEKEDA